MKKILLLTALLAMAISCTKDKAPKTLVLYYSETGNTRVVAEALQQKLGADIEEILPVVPYTGDFQATIERGRKEMEENKFPELQPLKSDIASYDIIFLGFPVWFGTYANPVETLLRSADFAGKKIVPFCTFGMACVPPASTPFPSKSNDSSSAKATWKEPTRNPRTSPPRIQLPKKKLPSSMQLSTATRCSMPRRKKWQSVLSPMVRNTCSPPATCRVKCPRTFPATCRPSPAP